MFFFALISLALTATGAATSYVSQRTAAKNAEKAAAYNADAQRKQAKHEADVTAENLRRASVTKRKRIASARARLAGSGVTLSGSAIDDLIDTSETLERDIQDVAYKSNRDTQVALSNANMGLWEGKERAAGMRTSANASLLTGIGGFASQAYDYDQKGAFDSFKPTRTSI